MYCNIHPRDDEDADRQWRDSRDRETARQTAQSERKRELGDGIPDAAGEALRAALREYFARCVREGRAPCDLREAIEGIGAEGRTAQEWWEMRTRG